MIFTLRDLLSQHSAARSAKPALVEGQERITYNRLIERVRTCGSNLQSRGIQKGDRVAIYLPRSIDAVVALFATWYIGGVAVFINNVLKTRQVNYILEHAE